MDEGSRAYFNTLWYHMHTCSCNMDSSQLTLDSHVEANNLSRKCETGNTTPLFFDAQNNFDFDYM